MAHAALYFERWNSTGLDRHGPEREWIESNEVPGVDLVVAWARRAIKESSNPGCHALIWEDGRHVGTLSRHRNGSIRLKRA